MIIVIYLKLNEEYISHSCLVKENCSCLQCRFRLFLEHPQYSQEEKEFMFHLELNSKKSLEDYHLYLDGKELSQPELDFAIGIIRKLRSAINKGDGK